MKFSIFALRKSEHHRNCLKTNFEQFQSLPSSWSSFPRRPQLSVLEMSAQVIIKTLTTWQPCTRKTVEEEVSVVNEFYQGTNEIFCRIHSRS
jgi:hypothetical protein